MNTNQKPKGSLGGEPAIRVPVVFALLAAAIIALWFSAAPSGMADNTCTVCHKAVQTISGLACNSLDYFRHKDHGDPDGPCQPTTTEAFH